MSPENDSLREQIVAELNYVQIFIESVMLDEASREAGLWQGDAPKRAFESVGRVLAAIQSLPSPDLRALPTPEPAPAAPVSGEQLTARYSNVVATLSKAKHSIATLAAENAKLTAEIDQLKKEWMDRTLDEIDIADKRIVAKFLREVGDNNNDVDLWAQLVAQRDDATARLAALERIAEEMYEFTPPPACDCDGCSHRRTVFAQYAAWKEQR